MQILLMKATMNSNASQKKNYQSNFILYHFSKVCVCVGVSYLCMVHVLAVAHAKLLSFSAYFQSCPHLLLYSLNIMYMNISVDWLPSFKG